MTNIDELITSRAAAAALEIDPRQVARLVERGDLTPAIKAPGARGAYLFDPAAVELVRAARRGA